MQNLSQVEQFLKGLLEDHSKLERMVEVLSAMVELARSGYDQAATRKALNVDRQLSSFLFDVARSRISVSNKFSHWDRIWLDRYLASYSTPEIICEHRSRKIRDRSIIDIGSGSGMQTIFFSMTNDYATGVEMLPERYLMSQLNSYVYSGSSANFLQGDAKNSIAGLNVDGNTVIFSDPARSRNALERTVEDLTPSPLLLMKLFSDRTHDFVFDLPPQTHWENVPIKGEKEYISIDGELNRLTLYTGSLADSSTSAVLLPRGIRYSGKPRDLPATGKNRPRAYLYLTDISIIRARLLHVVLDGTDLEPLGADSRRYLLTSDSLYEAFPGDIYSTLFTCEIDQLSSMLMKAGAGRVFPRFSLRDGEYYDTRAKLESGMRGNRDVYLFKFGEQFIGGNKTK